MPSNRVDQVSAPGLFRNHGQRLTVLERAIGRWSYVTPLAPATAPAGYNPLDPLGVPFQNGWGNTAGQQPVSFRLHPAGKVQIRGAPTGGMLPSVVFTLPSAPYFPPWPEELVFGSIGGGSVYTGRVDVNGDVWIFTEVVTPGGGTTAVLGTLADVVYADNPTSIAMDGSQHPAACILAAPPAWLDGSGNIIAAGLYYTGVQISVGTGPTTSGLYAAAFGPFVTTQIIPVDPINGAFPLVIPTDLQALGAGDTPYSATWQIQGQTDATGVLSVTPFVAQAAS